MFQSVKDWAPTKTLSDLADRAATTMGFDTSKSYPQVHEDLPEGSSAIQLYSLATPQGLKVSILLEELEVQYDSHVINISSGDQFKSGFLDINPNGKVPALLDKDGPNGKSVDLFESNAICIYLAKKYNKFIPRDGGLEAECMNWVFWQAAGQDPNAVNFVHFFICAPKDQSQARDYGVHRFGTETCRLLDVLDKHLEGKSYIVGDTFGIADIVNFPWIYSLHACIKHESGVSAGEYLQMDKYKNICAWADRISSRPAVQRGLNVCKADIGKTFLGEE
jgi:GST-like protein